MRSLYSWLLLLLGGLTVALGAWLLIGERVGERTPAQPHHDFAGPTDFTSHDVTLISIGVIALGCGLLGLGGWLRYKITRASRSRSRGAPDLR